MADLQLMFTTEEREYINNQPGEVFKRRVGGIQGNPYADVVREGKVWRARVEVNGVLLESSLTFETPEAAMDHLPTLMSLPR